MENVVKFEPKRASVGPMVTVSLDDVIRVLAGQTTVQDLEWERRHKERIDALMAFDVPTLREIWDNIGDDSYYDGPHGCHDIADVYRVMNMKGDGHYCAV
ncbi:hypothetical protein [Brevundimonas pondensis]|uniref:Uncharacterized protein n=1 Tax=Brevundimonas pondensis TaxID=2774189 RepID=A0ABX7SMK7_9CAUL|nr:hypothetical protein [Brevundimonas pondensis]QTC88120.1 hypothetical protein IFE19_01545 [Brevundimonas pondensis]